MGTGQNVKNVESGDYEGFTRAISAKDIKEINTLLKDYEYNIDEIVRNEVLGYLGDYE